jgi:hypothetical protein
MTCNRSLQCVTVNISKGKVLIKCLLKRIAKEIFTQRHYR